MERLQSVTQVWIDDDTKKTRTVKTEYDETGGAVVPDKPVTPAPGDLPDDFPGKAALMRAGLDSIEAIRDYLRSRPLTLIEGIDPLTADAIKALVAATPVPVVEAKPPVPAAATAIGVTHGAIAGPVPEVGDKVKVGAKKGTISKVENGVATEITFHDGSTTHTEKADVTYEFLDPAKAKKDK